MLIKVFLGMIACFYLLSCDLPATGGNPGEGRPCNEKVLKVHADSLGLEMTAICAYKKECSVKLGFYVIGLPDSLQGMCFGGGAEWRYESIDTSMTVTTELNKPYSVKLSQDDHLRFSLFDINNVEKKYDIDLSGIIHSYTVRGDSVEVNVMNGCALHLYSCKKEIVYGNRLSNGMYTFFIADGCDSDYSYDCIWHNQGPSQKDDLSFYVTVYWRN